jgi:hypothetical protein
MTRVRSPSHGTLWLALVALALLHSSAGMKASSAIGTTVPCRLRLPLLTVAA